LIINELVDDAMVAKPAHLVGGGEQRLWNGESERFGGLEIENQLEFGRLYDRKIGGFSPLRMRPV